MSAGDQNQPASGYTAPHAQHRHTRLQIAGTLVAFVVICFLWVVNCSGPRPSWSHLQVQPPSGSSQQYQVSLEVSNSGPGHGQVNVIVRLRSKTTGQTYEQDQAVMLDPGETTNVSVQINAPPGQYTPEVELQYPPR